jgi:hypothetical protein
MFKGTLFYLVSILSLLFSACDSDADTDKIPLARVSEKVLYLSDLRSVIPAGLTKDDSLMLAEDYIRKWIMNELLVRKAEENLSAAMKDLSKEVNDYRNSMLTYRYKMELMLQKLDTVVSQKEIAEYYNLYKENFILNKTIVKAIFIQIPSEVSKPEQVKVFCEQVTDDNLRELQEYCLKYAINYDIYADNWVDLDMITKNLPEQIEDENRFLSRNATFEVRTKDFYYLLCIIDYRLANKTAPVEYVEVSIKNLIINKRKIDFLKKLEEDVYLEGVRNNKFKLYDYEPENQET